jgi:hypothetical protein
MDAEQRQIVADHVHHRRDRALTEQRQPFGFGPDELVAIFSGQLACPTGTR